MAADKTITINFVPKGDAKLIAAFQGLAKAQKKFNKTTQRVTKDTGLLGDAFSVIRSKMLLFNFAMGLGIRQLVAFSKEAAKVDSMERAFTNMTGSVENAEKRLDALKSATNDTMSEFNLFQQANNAMVLGITRNTQEMAEMFDAAQRLGRALGRDTASSVESLITGIGRQSRLMLDNIGIIVKTDKAYEKYAISLGKSAEALSDGEKKQAFFNATMEAAERKLAILGQEIPTAQDRFDKLAASMSNASVSIGEALLPVLEPTVLLVTKLADAFNTERAKSYGVALAGLATSIAIYAVHLKRAVILQTMTGWGALATGVGILSAELLNLSGVMDDSNDGLQDSQAKTVSYLESIKKMKTGVLQAQINHKKHKLSLIQGTDAYKDYNKELTTATAEIEEFQSKLLKAESMGAPQDAIDGFKQLISIAKSQRDSLLISAPEGVEEAARINLIIKELQSLVDILGLSGMSYEQFNEAQEKANALYNKTPESQKAAIDANIEFIKGLDESVISAEKQKAILEMLETQYSKNASASEVYAGKLAKSFGQISNAGVALAKGNQSQTIAALQLGKAQGLANIYVGATQAIRAKGLLGVIEGVAVIAQGMSTIANIDQQIKAAKAAPIAETGGLIGGRRHSQGGTIIEAEQGEFIMSRRAVNAVGVEAMNRINQGGGSGAVNISFAGNVMSQDFIEDEAIPMIKEAIRRGADIGVS
jgi:hypothetical protein